MQAVDKLSHITNNYRRYNSSRTVAGIWNGTTALNRIGYSASDSGELLFESIEYCCNIPEQ